MDSLFTNTALPTNEFSIIWYRIFVAVLIGLLIGVERESTKQAAKNYFAGIRTVPLISIFGFLAALIATKVGVYIFIAFFLIFGLLIAISYFFSSQTGEIGGTTEMTYLIVFVLGALAYWDYLLLAGSIAVLTAVFLTFKTELRNFAGKLEEEDLYAAIKFALITVIILPLLPDETYDPFNVLNPRQIWYFVVLIAGINFVGFVLFKLIGAKQGIQLLSVFGGLASSTALTITFAQRSKNAESLSRSFAAGILLASTIMFPRILLIIFIIAPELISSLVLPVIVFSIAGIVISFFLWIKKDSTSLKEIDLYNPFSLKFAVKFGLIFTVVLFASAAAQEYFGSRGIYITSFISGFANMDAVALTISDLIKNTIDKEVGITALVIAFISNTIIKGVITSFFGTKQLRKYSLIGFAGLVVVMLIYLVILLI